ncbi:site-specific DNA-methyltransferase [Halobaculum sp. MBLA0147]|uniref:DNA-methyltransferase n=1 Tax=Halobaculum sp. MBLA0147 TaxID=3079934 RepID=UPI003523D0F9
MPDQSADNPARPTSAADTDHPAYEPKPDRGVPQELVRDPSPDLVAETVWPVPVSQRQRDLHSVSVSAGPDAGEITVRPGDVLEYIADHRKELLLVQSVLPAPDGVRLGTVAETDGLLLTFSNRLNDFRTLDLSAHRGHASDAHSLEINAPLLTTGEHTLIVHEEAVTPTTGITWPSFNEMYRYKRDGKDSVTTKSDRQTRSDLTPDPPVPDTPAYEADDLRNEIITGDVRDVLPQIATNSVDAWVTSPPYYDQRDYDHRDQLGREDTAEDYLTELLSVIQQLMRVTKPTGMGWLVIDDTFTNGARKTIPQRLQVELTRLGYDIFASGPWVKESTMPDPAPNRPSHTHETVIGIADSDIQPAERYFTKECADTTDDTFDATPGQSGRDHDAVFPVELPERLIKWSVPDRVCGECGAPLQPEYAVTDIRDLDTSRPQARRALEIADEEDLSDADLRALRAVGLSATGQGSRVQDGAGQNATETEQRAATARETLGSYAREFTAPLKNHAHTSRTCDCQTWRTQPGLVFDPFIGSGTTGLAANKQQVDWSGIELNAETAASARDTLTTHTPQLDLTQF